MVSRSCAFSFPSLLPKWKSSQAIKVLVNYVMKDTHTPRKNFYNKIRWECSKRSSLKCKGCLTTDIEMRQVMSTSEHNHESDPFQIAAMKLKAEIKASVEVNRGKPHQIVTDKLHSVPLQVRTAAGQPESLKRQVRRFKKGTTPKEPESNATIPNPLPEEYTKTEGRQFLIYDNGLDSSRLLVFASEIGLQLLAEADTWFMDGTHPTSPTQFQQLFCVRVPLGNSHVSAVYALLPSKLQSIYEECLTAILDSCLQSDLRSNPTTVVIDYEVAIHNTVRSVVSPNIHIQGCFYHLTQSTWRHLQSEGLQTMYTEDEETRNFVGMIDGLAFLPVERVCEGMRVLKELVPEHLTGLLDYFDSNYVSGSYRSVVGRSGLLRFRRTPPRFEPQTWNVHEATINDQHRTNNVCESWNNSLVGHNNPSMWTVIGCLHKDCSMVETEHYMYQRGEPPKKRVKKQTVVHQKRLKTLCEQLVREEKSLSEFMFAKGCCIRLK